MTGIHLKNDFLDWWEDRLSPRKKEKIERHLQDCSACREYFQRMSAFFAPPDRTIVPSLPVQPWEKTRFTALLESQQKISSGGAFHQKWKGALAWLAISFLALLSGFWLSQNLSSKASFNPEALAFTESFQSVNETSFDEMFEQLVSSLSEENHEN